MSELKTSITWSEWKEQWERATDVPARMGLLHSGFDTMVVSNYQEAAERLQLYCTEVAQPEEKWGAARPLAYKALNVLAHNFFQRGAGGDLQIIFFSPPEVARAFMEVFRTDIKPLYQRIWIGFSHSLIQSGRLPHSTREIISSFITDFSLRLWAGIENHPDYNQETMTYLTERRVAAIEILSALDNLGVLYKHRWEFFDAAAFKRLEEIVLLGFKTIEEAIFFGSAEARVYIVAQIGIKEAERREKLRVAQQKIEEGQSEVAQLRP